ACFAPHPDPDYTSRSSCARNVQEGIELMPEVAELDALVEKAKTGDQSAVVKLLDHFSPQVRAKIRSKVNLPWQSLLDEEDVMQVTALEACVRIEKFTSGGSREFLAWL